MPTPLARLFGRTGARTRRGGDQGYGLRLAAALAESVLVKPEQPLHVLTSACRLALRVADCRVALIGLRCEGESDPAPTTFEWLAGGCRRRDRLLLEEALNGRHSPLPTIDDQPLWIRMGDDPFQPGAAVLRRFNLTWLLALPGQMPVGGLARCGVLVLAGTGQNLDLDYPMIRDARLIWLAAREHLLAAAHRIKQRDASPWPETEAAWNEAPTALAAVTNSQVLSVNQRARQLLAENVGGDDGRLQGWLLGAVRRLESSGQDREVMTASMGKNRFLEVAVGPLLSAEGLRLVALHPSTAPAASPKDRESSIRMLGHELRTPLTAMKTSLDLVLSGEAGALAPEQVRFLGATRRNLERLNRLLSELLETRPGGGVNHRVIDLQAVDLGAVLHDELSMLEVVCREKGLALETSGLPQSFHACVDADKVQQMLYNIVGNAIKYTAQGGVVRVALSDRLEGVPGVGPRLMRRFDLPPDVFTLIIEDTGLGMSKAFLCTLFQPFNREDRAEARGLPGAGLGLHITRGLVEAHGGLIELQSRPGRGTTVWIVLPREPQSGGALTAGRQLAALHNRAVAAGIACSVYALDLRDRLAESQPWEIEAAMEQAMAFLARLGRQSSNAEAVQIARSAGSLGWPLAPGLCCGLVMDQSRLDAAWQVAVAAPESVRLLDETSWRELNDVFDHAETVVEQPLQRERRPLSPMEALTDAGCPPQRVGV